MPTICNGLEPTTFRKRTAPGECRVWWDKDDTVLTGTVTRDDAGVWHATVEKPVGGYRTRAIAIQAIHATVFGGTMPEQTETM